METALGCQATTGAPGEVASHRPAPGHSPAVVAADAPHADAHDGLRVQHGAVHGVHQAEHIVLQDQVHVFALDSTRKCVTFLQKHPACRVCGCPGAALR